MLKVMSVRAQLIGMLVGIVILLIIFASIVWNSVGSISRAAEGMGMGKDVVADILPPPLYLLEAEMTVLQLQEAKAEEVQPLLAKLASLKKDYDDRNTFWDKAALDTVVKTALLGEQKQSADNFGSWCWVTMHRLLNSAKVRMHAKLPGIFTSSILRIATALTPLSKLPQRMLMTLKIHCAIHPRGCDF